MSPALSHADEANLRAHNARIATRAAERRLARSLRSVGSLRATLTMERACAREAEEILRGIIGLSEHASRIEATMGQGMLALHLRAAIRTLGGEP